MMTEAFFVLLNVVLCKLMILRWNGYLVVTIRVKIADVFLEVYILPTSM